MKKFSDNLKSLNESFSQTPITNLNEFLTFGKKVCSDIMEGFYNDSAVETILSEMFYNNKGDCNLALESLNLFTMNRKELTKTVNQKFNTILEEFKHNPNNPLIETRMIKLVSEFPYILNETVLNNTAVLLENFDIQKEFKSNIGSIKNISLSYYSPSSLEELTKILKLMRSTLKESVMKSEPGSWKVELFPDGYGGYNTNDVIKVIQNQIKRSCELGIQIDKTISNISSFKEEDNKIKTETLKWFSEFMNSTGTNYVFDPRIIQSNGVDIDFFIKLGLDQFITLINKYSKHLIRNFRNERFTLLNDSYKKYIDYCALGTNIVDNGDENNNSIFTFERNESFEKMYELFILLTQLAHYQEMHKRKFVHQFLNVAKPMVDSVRIDIDIYYNKAL